MSDPTTETGDAIRVTVEDLETGATEKTVVPMHDYLILVTGDASLSVNAHANGTHVLTVKGRRP